MDNYLTKNKLKERGWSGTQIKKFLEKPDLTTPNPPGFAMNLYSESRIVNIEASEPWKALSEKAKQTRQGQLEAAEAKKNNLLYYISTVNIVVKKLPIEELIEEACQNYNTFKYASGVNFTPLTPESDKSFLHKICVNYLRHSLSSYEDNLRILYGKSRTGSAYMTLTENIYTAISESYPELKQECERQLRAKKKNHGIIC